IRWIKNDEQREMFFFTFKEILFFHFYHFFHLRGFDVDSGSIQHSCIDIITYDLSVKFLHSVDAEFFYFLKQIFVVIAPVLKGKFFPENLRRKFHCHHCCFYKNCSAATHRIQKVSFSVPACKMKHSSSQHFVNRCFALLFPVTALEQRISRRIQRNSNKITVDMKIEFNK